MKKFAVCYQASFQELKHVKTLTTAAMLMAVSVVLGYFTIEAGPYLKIGFGGVVNQLRLKLSNRAAVLHHRFLKLPCRLPECLRNLKYLRRIDREMAQLAVRILSNIHLYSSTSSI